MRSADGTRAVVEMAEASGLSRVVPAERDPIGATSIGTGEVLRAVLDAGVLEVTLGIGGSATTTILDRSTCLRVCDFAVIERLAGWPLVTRLRALRSCA